MSLITHDADPDAFDQAPVPACGALACKEATEEHTVWSIPALAVLGPGNTLTDNVDAVPLPHVFDPETLMLPDMEEFP